MCVLVLDARATAAAPASYTIVDLGAPTSYSIGFGLNEVPVVVGHLETASSVEATRWDAGLPTTLPGINGQHSTLARAVNESGVVAGESYDGTSGTHAVTWSGTTVTDLGTLNGTNYSSAFAINDLGQVAGEGYVSVQGYVHAIRWDGGSPTDLGVIGTGNQSHGRGINNSGVVAGDSESVPDGATHAVIWDGGVPTDLGTLPTDTYSNATAINEAGHVTGRSGGRPDGAQYGFFWDGASMTEMAISGGGTFVEAMAINDHDQVVGRTDQFYGGYQTAFLWEASTGTAVDLGILIPFDSGWQLIEAYGINNAGQITGYGYHDGVIRAYLMTPEGDPGPTDTATADLPAGGTISTDAGVPGATPSDPVATTVVTPVDGVVTIEEGVGSPGVPGFTLFGQPITISAPPSIPEAPFRITFTVDASVVPPGEDANTVEIFRDGDLALPCPGSSTADPDPCVTARQQLGDGDISITVLSAHASSWGAFTRDPFPFHGFFAPVDNPPTLNVLKAGGAVPVRFSLGGDFGLGILADGSPASRPIPCDGSASTDPLEQTASSGESGLHYDAATGMYTYVWKTSKAWTNCRELVLTLTDGSVHGALFKFKR